MRKTVIAAILILAALACAGIGGYRYYQEKTAGSEYASIREEVAESLQPPEEAPVEEAEEPPAEEAEEQPAASAVDFTALAARCPDAYAWIRIDDTGIDYPVVQHPTDDTYYLTHSAEGEASRAGAIYTETLNSRDFTDPNTVIYGHNMKNGSMFRTLHSFEDRDFFNSHDQVLIYTPSGTLTYKIFAAYRSDDRHILQSYDFQDPFAFEAYLEEIRMQKSMAAFVRDDVTVTSEDRIITLSTCTGDDSSRYIVQAVLQP